MPVEKVIEIVGISTESWEDAIKTAVKETAKTVRNIVGVEVVCLSGRVENGDIVEYRAKVKIRFTVERP